MVMVGSALLIAINGIGAGFSASFNKQFSNLAPNILFVTNSQLEVEGVDQVEVLVEVEVHQKLL